MKTKLPELVETISKLTRPQINKRKIWRTLKVLPETLAWYLAQKGTVRIPRFGKFIVRAKPHSRGLVSPKSYSKYDVKILFRPSKILKIRLNKYKNLIIERGQKNNNEEDKIIEDVNEGKV